MTSIPLRFVLALAVVALATTLHSPATHAALGQDGSSVSADSAALHTPVRSTPTVQYTLQELSGNGMTVHEYLTLQGQVFAVSWQGPTPPNLRQLLGSYFARFQNAAATAHQINPGMHRQFALDDSDLVVHSSGRLRAFRGFAYLPSLVPAGVVLQQLQ